MSRADQLGRRGVDSAVDASGPAGGDRTYARVDGPNTAAQVQVTCGCVGETHQPALVLTEMEVTGELFGGGLGGFNAWGRRWVLHGTGPVDDQHHIQSRAVDLDRLGCR